MLVNLSDVTLVSVFQKRFPKKPSFFPRSGAELVIGLPRGLIGLPGLDRASRVLSASAA